MNKTLTASERSTIMDACHSISRSADALKECHAVDNDWGDDLDAKAFYDAEMQLLERLVALLAALPGQPEPIDMLLFCPKCGVQHIDAPEPFAPVGRCECAGPDECETCESNRAAFEEIWHNPPHRSHLCHACGTIWRPADVPTNGVGSTQTRGNVDTWDGKPEPRTEAAEEQPSLTKPLTPYGMLVRALRIVSGTTLFEMAELMRVSASTLSAMEFGRRPVTYDNAVFASDFFSDKGAPDTLSVLAHAAARAGEPQ
ncbi:helix-turn-helix domain-containing protein [Burkholderia anthina]|uniref:helix-turn-helix domain-containing protein n=1 Tax=Burkholderia anthina TaxID=179879 RepID=UPI00158CEEB5|nr:helix-turn-helix transcriptional regulator [Burkholderia anthina]